MIEETVTQSQGRIRRQILRQQYAQPLNDELEPDFPDLFDGKKHADRFMQIISDKLVSDLDMKMLETNPFMQIKTDGDEIKINRVPSVDVWKWPKFDHGKKNELELTLVNGVYE